MMGALTLTVGPVVIPLLREYVVEEGWVVQRDFLLALAIIQAMYEDAVEVVAAVLTCPSGRALISTWLFVLVHWQSEAPAPTWLLAP